MKICVYGVGAVGGLIAARLMRGGLPVSGVARGANLETIRRDGLTLVDRGDQGESRESFDLAVTDDVESLGPQDLVVISVKSTALPSIAAGIGPLLSSETVVLSAMNGVPWWFFHGLPGAPEGLSLPSLDPGDALARAIPVDQVLGSVTHLSASCPEPGTVRHSAGQRIILGDPKGPVDDRVQRVAGVLRQGGFEMELSDRIQRDIWYKLWGNMTMNPISGMTGATMDRILDDRLVRHFVTLCMREAAEVGAHVGLPISEDPETRHEVTRRLGAVRTSMLQDVDAGRPIELDALVTVVSELAAALAVPTPNIDALLGLARLHGRVRGLYPEDILRH